MNWNDTWPLRQGRRPGVAAYSGLDDHPAAPRDGRSHRSEPRSSPPSSPKLEGGNPERAAFMSLFHDTQETRATDIPYIGAGIACSGDSERS
jgi:hypothetical protein